MTQGHTVTNIPNAIDTSVFSPMDKQQARAKHKLPEDKRLVLFGAQRITDERKGFRYLTEACEYLGSPAPQLESQLGVVVLGGDAESREGSPCRCRSIPSIT